MSARFRRGEGARPKGSGRYRFAIAAAMVLVSLAGVSSAETGVFESYRQALTAYRAGHYGEAESLFSAIVQRDEPQPETLKSHYFLARTKMKLKKWDQASTLLRGIYSTSPAFYSEWNCDFLLGECRKAMGDD